MYLPMVVLKSLQRSHLSLKLVQIYKNGLVYSLKQYFQGISLTPVTVFNSRNENVIKINYRYYLCVLLLNVLLFNLTLFAVLNFFTFGNVNFKAFHSKPVKS